jgi:hypothetical protein
METELFYWVVSGFLFLNFGATYVIGMEIAHQTRATAQKLNTIAHLLNREFSGANDWSPPTGGGKYG